MPFEKETKDKIADSAMVAAKITGVMGINALLIVAKGLTGSNIGEVFIPRPLNMWN